MYPLSLRGRRITTHFYFPSPHPLSPLPPIHTHTAMATLVLCSVTSVPEGWIPLRKTFLRTGTDRKVSFVLEPFFPTESSQDKGNFSVRSRPEENYPEWKPAFTKILTVLPVYTDDEFRTVPKFS